MIEAAERGGRIQPDTILLEPTSGNTGIALAFVAAVRGYRLVLLMPDTMSIERRKLLAAFGAELVLTPGSEGMPGAIARAAGTGRLRPALSPAAAVRQPGQPRRAPPHDRRGNLARHGRRVDVLVSGVGTGGTLTGVGEVIKPRKPSFRIVAVEPAESPVLSGGKPGPHKIQGIGAGFVPEVLRRELIDEIITVTGAEAGAMARRLAREEGIISGISCGAAMAAASRWPDARTAAAS